MTHFLETTEGNSQAFNSIRRKMWVNRKKGTLKKMTVRKLQVKSYTVLKIWRYLAQR